MPTRKPAVAGYFYPGEVDQLRRELERCLSHPKKKKIPAIGIVSPHAGYKYSGVVAGEVFGQIEIPNRIIVLSPNHTGEGATKGMMIRHATSGDVTGDYKSVVGYAGLVVS